LIWRQSDGRPTKAKSSDKAYKGMREEEKFVPQSSHEDFRAVCVEG